MDNRADFASPLTLPDEYAAVYDSEIGENHDEQDGNRNYYGSYQPDYPDNSSTNEEKLGYDDGLNLVNLRIELDNVTREKKEAYLRNRREREQCVRTDLRRRALDSSVDVWNWSYRTTSCDVVSVVTTNEPLQYGEMRDIRTGKFNKEMRRIKPPQNPPGGAAALAADTSGTANTVEGVLTDKWFYEVDRAKINDILKRERDEFMAKLNRARRVREVTEDRAATSVQTAYRKYSLQKTLRNGGLAARAKGNLFRRLLLTLYRSQMDAGRVPPLVLQWGEHREGFSRRRHGSALVIQRAYRCHQARRHLARTQHLWWLQHKRRAVVTLQCWVRGRQAVEKVLTTRLAYLRVRSTRAATGIQTCFRALAARRKVQRWRYRVRYCAATIIQTMFRVVNSRWRLLDLSSIMMEERLQRGARRMQTCVRARLARTRVARIKCRYLYLYLFSRAQLVQRYIRRFCASRRVRRVLVGKRRRAAGEAEAAVVRRALGRAEL